MKKIILAAALFALSFARTFAQEHILWMQQPAISPDGNSIAFEYKGNIFKVAASGGAATPAYHQYFL